MENLTVKEFIEILNSIDNKSMPIRIFNEEQFCDFPIDSYGIDESGYDGKKSFIINLNY